MSVFRNIYINDEIPYAEMKNVRFPFGFGWQNLTVSDQEGTPCLVYLKEGKNTVSLEVTVGGWAEVLQAVGDVTVDMNTLYRRIIIVTSTNPDPYRDYSLEKEIRDLRETLEELRDPAEPPGGSVRRDQREKIQPVGTPSPGSGAAGRVC